MLRLVAFLLLCPISAVAADCIPFEQSRQHIGAVKCVRGKVLKVAQGDSGTHFLNFCDDWRKCAFTVVVFPDDLRDIGDVRALEGRTIEISGTIREYNGRAEIILSDSRQLHGEKLPPVPKTYDAERRGSFSAGRFSRAGDSSSNTRTRRTKGRRSRSHENPEDPNPPRVPD